MNPASVFLLNYFGAGLGALLATPLLLTRRPMSFHHRAMGYLLLLVSAVQFLITLDHSAPSHLPWLEGPEVSLTLLSGPLLLSFVSGRPVWKGRWGWLHLTPVACTTLFYLAAGIIGRPWEVDFAWIVSLQAGYTLVSWFVFQRSGVSDLRLRNWTLSLLVVFALVHLAQMLRLSIHGPGLLREVVPLTLTAGLTLLAVLGFRLAIRQPKGDYSRNEMDQGRAREYLERLEQLFVRERVHTNPHLDLRKLAAALEVKPHLLSQILNQFAEESFFDMVNRHRIEEAKSLLSDPGYDHYTVEGVGETAGFCSRATFYSRFRKATPGEFRKRRGTP